MYPQAPQTQNGFQIAGQALMQGGEVLGGMSAMIEKRKQALIEQRRLELEAQQKAEQMAFEKEMRENEFKIKQDESNRLMKAQENKEKFQTGVSKGVMEPTGKMIPSGRTMQTGQSMEANLLRPPQSEEMQPETPDGSEIEEQARRPLSKDEMIQLALETDQLEPKDYLSQTKENRGFGNKLQKFAGDDGLMKVFDPMSGTASNMTDADGNTVSAREYYSYFQTEGGGVVPLSKSRPPTEAPQPIPGLISKGTEKSNLDKQKTRIELEDATRENELGKDIPATQAIEIGGINQAISDLDKLESVIPKITTAGVFTPIIDPIQGKNPWSTRGQAKKQYIASIKQTIGKGLEGGVLRAEDERKYEKIIPNMGDTPEVFVSKLIQLRDMLKGKKKYSLEALKSARFNTSGFDTKENPKLDKAINSGKQLNLGNGIKVKRKK